MQLMKLLFVFIVLLLIAGLWLIRNQHRKQHWKPWMILPTTVVVLGLLVAGSPTLLSLSNQALLQFLPTDTGVPVDAIVILGRGAELRNERVEIALQLWQAKRAARLFVSGTKDSSEILGMLKASGIPSPIVSGEECSKTTQENALYTAAVLQPRGVQKILLITDPPHMLRSFLLFHSAGFTVIPYVTAPSPASINQGLFQLREYSGLIGYALTGKFERQIDVELEHGASEQLRNLITAACIVEG